MSAAGAKADLRARLQAWRRGLAPADVELWSLALTRHLLDWHGLGQVRTVMAYAALRREPQTDRLIAALRERGVAVALPLVEGTAMEPRLAMESPGQPPAACGPAVAVEQLDAVLVPGLAFDTAGRRLGRGGGHYDRFLARLRPDCLRIGVCFQGQVVAEVPTDPWDQPVDVIATEAGVRKGETRRATRA